jgi:hypothetical protein
LLGKYLKANERIVAYLLDSDELDVRLLPYARHVAPQAHMEGLLLPIDVKRRLELLVREVVPNQSLILYLQGSYSITR